MENRSLEIRHDTKNNQHCEGVSNRFTEDRTFLTNHTRSCASNRDGLRRDHFTANTTGGVSSRHEVRVNAELFTSRTLQSTEECVCGRVRTSEEYAQPAEYRSEERIESTRFRHCKTHRRAHTAVVQEVCETEDDSDRPDSPTKREDRFEEARNCFTEAIVRNYEYGQDTRNEDCRTTSGEPLERVFSSIRSVLSNDRSRFDNFVVETRPCEGDVRRSENRFNSIETPSEYEYSEENEREPCADNFAHAVLEFYCAFTIINFIREFPDVFRFPNFEEYQKTDDRNSCGRDVREVRANEVSRVELCTCEAATCNQESWKNFHRAFPTGHRYCYPKRNDDGKERQLTADDLAEVHDVEFG